MPAPCDETPLIDISLADELFFPQGNETSDALQWEIWSDLTSRLLPDLQAIITGGHESDALKSELHRIRGYCSTCALIRLAAFLYEWEYLPDPLGATKSYAPEAIALARRSMLEIEIAYPQLKPPAS